MRRRDKEITDMAAIEAIIRQAQICRLGLADDDGTPYIVPVNFGYHDRMVYVHSAVEGRKIDILKRNNNVCVEFDIDAELIKAERACNWSLKYRSVIGFGTAVLIEDADAKRTALDYIMRQYAPEETSFSYAEESLGKIAIIQIRLEQVSGKMSGY